MKNKIALGARVFLGLIYFIFGLNFFLNFIPVPPPPEGAAGAFMGGLFGSGYFFQVLKVVEVLGGLALLTGFFAPLALVVLAPVTVHIFLYHTILTPGLENAVMPTVLVVLHVLAATLYPRVFRPLLQPKPLT